MSYTYMVKTEYSEWIQLTAALIEMFPDSVDGANKDTEGAEEEPSLEVFIESLLWHRVQLRAEPEKENGKTERARMADASLLFFRDVISAVKKKYSSQDNKPIYNAEYMLKTVKNSIDSMICRLC